MWSFSGVGKRPQDRKKVLGKESFMKKILKRSFAVLLSLLLCFGSLHIRVAADGEEGVPGAAGPGVITFVNHTGLEDGESYLLTEDAGGTFTVVVHHESAAEDVVLVVESPAYGLAFAALPKAGAGIAEAVLLDPHTMAIRLAPSKKAASFAVDLRLKKVTLRIGYRNRLEHWSVNNLHVHDVTHSIVLGISL